MFAHENTHPSGPTALYERVLLAVLLIRSDPDATNRMVQVLSPEPSLTREASPPRHHQDGHYVGGTPWECRLGTSETKGHGGL